MKLVTQSRSVNSVLNVYLFPPHFCWKMTLNVVLQQFTALATKQPVVQFF